MTMSLRESFARVRALVIGDVILDRFVDGTSTRCCPEDESAPVIDWDGQDEHFPGGAANVAANLVSLGAGMVTLIGVEGDDEHGEELKRVVISSGVKRAVLRDKSRLTLAKCRISIDGKLVTRVDRGSSHALEGMGEALVIHDISKSWATSDLVVIADYGKGVMTSRVIATIAELNQTSRKTLVVDAKDLGKYRECRPTAVTPNFLEAVTAINLPAYMRPSDRQDFLEGFRSLIFDYTGAFIVAVTLDSDGAYVFDGASRPDRTHAVKVDQPHPSGAGDSYTAAFALSLASGASRYEAADLAQGAANVAVSKPHTHAVTLAEIEATEQPEANRPRTVLVNGVFDILHVGHIHLLTEARKFGDRLVVGINDDESVAILKAGRPVNNAEDRAAMLIALGMVDHVIVFKGTNPSKLIRSIRPDVVAKGSDYEGKSLVEQPAIDEVGCRVAFVPMVPGKSTTRMLERVRCGSSYAIDDICSASGVIASLLAEPRK